MAKKTLTLLALNPSSCIKSANHFEQQEHFTSIIDSHNASESARHVYVHNERLALLNQRM